MKSPYRSLALVAALVLSPLALHAQTAATPAAGGAAGAGGAAKKAATSHSSGDKQLVKQAADAQMGVLHMTELFAGQTPPGSDPVQATGKKIGADLNKSWGELAQIAQARATE